MRNITLTALTLSLLALTSCESASRLASDIEGSWSSAPKSMSTDIAGSTSIVETVTFVRDESKSGTLGVQAMISATGAITGRDGLTLPYSLTSSAAATAEGTWRAIDDDEISVSIDPATITVTVDPEGVVLNTDLLTGEEFPQLDSIRPAVTRLLQERIERDVNTRFLSIRHLDDVKVKEDILKFEIEDEHFVMSRQP